ncbi:hypothetical protein NCAS_0D03580 [Naumovozyma castellii]|uniref:Nuclear cap-binding protein subunit 2 n=1 Tax=Naumovozyma castellii TaxID=27288 RepID=G0VEE8_NAUCA|nr:hypothetical protein NCAS_0D03580 [Naumovozyma castellii CBS 4309]CCC69939.1 hypothetical protein NCAS_0D03580 [Naumovozyma castellii CBS 4309]
MPSLAEFDELKFDHSVKRLDKPSAYLLRKARKNPNGLEELRQSLQSATIYVGNLSFYTSEEQIYELFSKCGFIKRIIMGLDRFKFTPCGFCFVIYSNAQEALNALKYLSDTKLDDKHITIDLDPGFEDGRQFGRGRGGGQVSDELRFEFDASRGGFALPFAEQMHTEGNNGFNEHIDNNGSGYIPPADAMGTFSTNQSRFGGSGDIAQEEGDFKPKQRDDERGDVIGSHDGMNNDENEDDNYIPQ